MAAAFLAAAATSGLLTSSAGSASTSLQPGTIEVALITPSSGYFAAHNLLIARGVTVAVEQLNTAGGVDGTLKLELVRRRLDSTSTPTQVIASLGAGVRAVILPCNIDAAAALASAAAKRGLLALAPCNPDPRSTGRLPLYWPVAMSGDQEAAQLVGYPATRWGTKTAFILTSNPETAYESALARNLKAAAGRVGVRIVGTGTVPLTGGNLQGLATTLRTSSAQVIFTPIFSPYVESIIARLRKANMRKPILATDGMDAQLDLTRYGGERLKDVSLASFGFPRESSKAFFRAYKEQFKNVPIGSFPALGLETVRTLAAAISKAQSSDPAQMDAAFASGLDVPGVGFADRRYPGGGAREPVAEVGIVDLIDGTYFPSMSSIPARVP